MFLGEPNVGVGLVPTRPSYCSSHVVLRGTRHVSPPLACLSSGPPPQHALATRVEWGRLGGKGEPGCGSRICLGQLPHGAAIVELSFHTPFPAIKVDEGQTDRPSNRQGGKGSWLRALQPAVFEVTQELP